MKILFILSILLSLGASGNPDNRSSNINYSNVCDIFLETALKSCDEHNWRRVRLEMNAFYRNCAIGNIYLLGSDPDIEQTAMGCWLRSSDQTLTQPEAEAIAESEGFHASTLFKYRLLDD